MRFKAFNRLIIFGILLSSIQLSYGQDSYQRLFDSDTRDIYASCSSPAEDGGVYLVNSYSIVSNPDSIGVSVSKHDDKGAVIWAMEYYAEDVTYDIEGKTIECQTMGGDTLAVVAVDMEFAVTSDDKILYIINPNDGSLIFYNRILDLDEEFEDAEPNLFTELLVDNAGNLNYFGTHNFMDTIAVHHEQIDVMNQSILSNSYYGIDSDTLPVSLQFFDAKTTRDSGFVFTAALELVNEVAVEVNEAAAVVKINEIGQVELANVYSTIDIPDGQVQFRSIAEVSDSSYVALGYARSMSSSNFENYIVVRLDTVGNILWSRNIRATDGVNMPRVDFREIMQTSSGEILIAGKYENIATQESGEVAVFFDIMGNELEMRQTSYISTASVFTGALDIHRTTDGSMLMSASGRSEDGRLSVMVNKIDAQGKTLCNQTPALTVRFDTLIVRDTFAIGQSRFIQRSEMDTVTVNSFNYDVPNVVLQDTVYCPNDTINYLLDATVDVGDPSLVSYMWETGDTTPTFTALDSGEYKVTVTVFKEECFILCTEVNVSRSNLPEALILNTYICDGDIRNLTVSNTQGAVVEAVWTNIQTGLTEMGTTITVDDNPNDMYSVTITDACGDTATASYTVPDRITIGSPLDNLLCGLEPGLVGRLELSGDITFEPIMDDDPIIHTPYTYLWDTGSTDRSIIINAPASGGITTHSLTITDVCGNLGVIDFSIDSDAFLLEEPTAAIAEPTFEDCMFSLQASGTPSLEQGGSIVSFAWTGPSGFTSDQSNILVVTPGTYTVVVTDDCGNTATASAEIAEPVLDVAIANNGLSFDCSVVSLVASSENQGLGDVTYVWNTNATGALLDVGETANASETYIVTATDCDGNMATASITVSADEFTPPPIDVEIVEESIDDCQKTLTASVSGASAGSSILWSTGETTPSILVEDNGAFSVTVTSACDIVAIAELEDIVVADLQFPNIFFPVNNLEEENDSFGPFVDCDLEIGEYTLEIYNRWGKRVFEADNIQERWRGTLNNEGNFLEEDVYMWQCFYTNGGGEQSQKGSVALVRK